MAKFKIPKPPPAPSPVPFTMTFSGFANGNAFILGIQVDAQGNLVNSIDSVIVFTSNNVTIPIQGTFNFTTNELDFAFGTNTAAGFDVQSFHGFILASSALAGIFQETAITVGPPVSIQQEEHGFWAFRNPQ